MGNVNANDAQTGEAQTDCPLIHVDKVELGRTWVAEWLAKGTERMKSNPH